MEDQTSPAIGVIIPALRYADPRAAVGFLERAFGFVRHAVFAEDDGAVAHAEMRFGNGIVMLGPAKDDPMGMRTPRELGFVTQSVYVIVDDLDAHHARAVAAGAEIVKPLGGTSYGSREYSARDPEGNYWSFGTYRPT